jgi:RpiR family carbohydrate utilization transcriptional regulator
MESDKSYEVIIKSKYPELSKSEKKVADFILLKGYDIAKMSISSLAKQCAVSEPTVMRFATHIGFSGYSDFKLKLIKDWGVKDSQNSESSLLVDLYIDENDNLEDIPAKMIYTTIRALNDTLNIIDVSTYKKAVEVITKAKVIDIYGVGNSGSIANDFMNKLMRIGLNVRALYDNHLQQISSLSLTKEDVAIAISHSGSTKDIVDTLKLAKQSGATTIALTNYKASKITEFADLVLCTGDFETTFYTETMVSRISQLAIVDMLYMGILLSDFQKYTSQLNKVNRLVKGKNY